MHAEAEELLRQAQIFRDQGRYDRALPLLEKAVCLEPDSREILWILSFSLRMVGRNDEAVEYGRRLVGLHPDEGAAHAHLGQFFIGKARFHDAIAAGEEAVRLDPMNGNSYWPIVAGNYELGRYDRAVEICRHALSADPSHYELRLHLGMVLAAAAHDRQADQVVDANLRDYAGDWYCYVCAGWAYWHLQQHDRAAAFFLEALRLNPDFPWQHEGMAFVRYAQGRKEEALQHYRDCDKGKFVWADVRRSMRQLKRHLREAKERSGK
jgi:tetratricopeptide (TPR) repeat protein